MDAPPELPPELLATLPPAVVAFIRWQAEQIRLLTARVAELEAKLAALEGRHGKHPGNSSLPPSSTHPHDKPLPKVKGKPPGGRSRGGQAGHEKHERALIPSGDCQAVISCRPTQCRRCGKSLSGTDGEPLRHQVWELPEIRPLVTEYQRHRLLCSCGTSTCGPLPDGVPTGQAGPRLVAFAALLMACFRQSKRRAAQFLTMLLGQPASASWLVCLQGRAADAVAPAYRELAEQLPHEPVLHVDESPTKEGTAKAWVWTFVAKGFTFFTQRTSRAAAVPKGLLGEDFAGLVHCDRARMYWAFGRLQWCWAHLLRDFQSLIESPCGTAKRLGHDLMRPSRELFGLWQKVRDGTLRWRSFRRRAQPIRKRIDALLLRGYFNEKTYGFCAELVEHKEHLWTFLEQPQAEPTNNAAERALRHAVIWRKLSFGTQSARGSRFVERLLTVIETCRRQCRSAFAWLVKAVQAAFTRKPAPSLLPGA